MIRSLRSVIYNKRAVTSVTGVILMVTISIMIATVLHINIQATSDSNSHINPMVMMRQSDNQITIIGIQYGPIIKDDVTIKVYDGSGDFVCNGILNPGINLASGDTIAISCSNPGAYDVLMIYQNTMIGSTKYVV
ncbi:MAG: hypothetical protein KAW45_07215 [Thermoplasmatales archaeon]|nr:hypothetical protein [Thermoplasmatales archaeon]